MAATGDLPMASSALSPLPHSNCVDPSDIDAFINYEQSYISPSPSSSSASQGKTTVSQQPLTSTGSTPTLHPSTSGFATSNQAQILYTAPSHQYDSYKQQTGLPMGGLADTMANNRNIGMSYGYQMGFQPDGMVQPMVDYSYAQRMQNQMRDTDMDMEGDVGLQYNFGQSAAKTEFVDPNALGGHELSPVVPANNQMGRMYPGIHQQQAARAKAQALQKHQEMLRRQQQAQTPQQPQPQPQQHQQQQPQQPEQQPQEQAQPERAPHSRQNSRSGSKPARPTDPLVEERISRLLQQMRQSSTASAAESMSPPKQATHISRPKKMEEEMDEDERLLASEEGKKLTSKERRQLRNKVSARAFRSRRKEYIGQLEGEVTAKTNEANDLRLQNRALMEENARLTDLTRTLLSSQHFASFLNEASVNGLPQNPQAMMQTPPQPESQDVQMPTPPNPMSTIPEQNFDFAALDVNGPGWNSGIDMSYNAPVFAVLEVPEPPLPAIETSILSGKDSRPLLPLSDNSKQLPIIERPVEPEPVQHQADPDVEIDESDPAFALFLDQPKTSTTQSEVSAHIPLEKPTRIELIVRDENACEPPDIAAVNLARFERLRASIEGPYQRVCQFTAHLE